MLTMMMANMHFYMLLAVDVNSVIVFTISCCLAADSSIRAVFISRYMYMYMYMHMYMYMYMCMYIYIYIYMVDRYVLMFFLLIGIYAKPVSL